MKYYNHVIVIIYNLIIFMISYKEALKLYDTALEENQNNAEFLKRKIAINKAKGQISDAIELLTDYLKT